MLKKNSILTGLLIGVFIPILSFVILLFLFQLMEQMGWVSSKGFSPQFRERTLGIVSIGLNAIPLNRAFVRRQTDTMRGIVIPTFIYVAVWLIFFGKTVF